MPGEVPDTDSRAMLGIHVRLPPGAYRALEDRATGRRTTLARLCREIILGANQEASVLRMELDLARRQLNDMRRLMGHYDRLLEAES